MYFLLKGNLSAQLNNELVAQFPFNNNLSDLSPSGITAVNDGATYVMDRTGAAASALQFDGSSKVTFGDQVVKVELPLAISVWVKVDVIDGTKTHTIFSSDTRVNVPFGYVLGIDENGGIQLIMSGLIGQPDTSDRLAFTSEPILVQDEWHHVAVIVRSQDVVEIFVDCVSIPGMFSGQGESSIFYSLEDSSIGWRAGDSVSPDGNYLEGALDDLQIWSRELTMTEIDILCQQGPIASGGMVEICDDAIDNDGDGLIDINDDDCICITNVPSGLIPNPSFEEMTCCPDRKDELECAVSWIQASPATTDYIHTCDNFLGHPGIPGAIAPLPFPDGEGAVGFRDGSGSSNYKEYTGAYLIAPLEVGTTYRLDFFVGIPDRNPRFDNTEIAVFFSDRQGSLPFGGNDPTFGCPSNGSDWEQIGEQSIEGHNEWINVVFEFTASKAFTAIALGPSCDPHPSANREPYYYLDRLALAEVSDFFIPLSSVEGNVCDDDLVLESEEALSYQWYLDGVAIIGETERSLMLNENASEGFYQVMSFQDEGCYISTVYTLDLEFLNTRDTIYLCDGDEYVHGTQTLTTEGVFVETIKLGSNCDSVSTVDVVIFDNSEYSESIEICLGDSVTVADTVIFDEGIFEFVTENYLGCDSTIMIDVDVNDEIPEVMLQDSFKVGLGEIIDISPQSLSSDISRIEWYDESTLISEELELVDFQPIRSGEIMLVAFNDFGCSTRASLIIELDRTVNTYTPNIVNKGSLPPDNTFIVGTNMAVARINELLIYDRWGSIKYQFSGDLTEYTGWDMRSNDKEVEQGVYTYLLDLELVDGERVTRAGNFTFIK